MVTGIKNNCDIYIEIAILLADGLVCLQVKYGH